MTYPNWITNPAFKAVLDNAHKLFSDACLLYDAKRYGTALFLALLAWEEVGKVYLEVLDEDAPRKRTNSHIKKQELAHVLEFQHELLPLIHQFLVENGHSNGTNDTVSYFVNVALMHAKPSHTKLSKRFANHIYDSILPEFKQNETAQHHQKILNGDIDKLKQSGIYCDIKGEKVLSTPDNIDPNLVSEYMSIVRRLLHNLSTNNEKPVAKYPLIIDEFFASTDDTPLHPAD